MNQLARMLSTWLIALGACSMACGCDSSKPKPATRNIGSVADDAAKKPAAGGATLPFSIELGTPFTFEGVPGLHSYASAQANVDGTKWLIVGGRASGLHGFEAPTANDPVNSFPPDGANDRIWVIDIENQKVWSLPLASLATMDPSLADTIDFYQWRATNTLSCQVGDELFIVGGYGYSPTATTVAKTTTFGELTVMQVSKVIDAIVNGKSIAPYVAQIADPRLKLTGGELLPFFGSTDKSCATPAERQFCAVFGQSFDGLYSVNVAGTDSTFQQTYSEQIAVFGIVDPPNLAIAANSFNTYPTSFIGSPAPMEFDGYAFADFIQVRPYHRRDLNVVPAMSPAGQSRIGVYGGVFQPGKFSAYMNPIYIDGIASATYEREGVAYSYCTFAPGTDHKFEQLLSQYKCATLPVFDPGSGQMTTIFFGGISNFRYDAGTNQLIKDPLKLAPNGRPIIDGVPFNPTVSALAVAKDGTSAGFILPGALPGYLGTEAELLIDQAVPQYPNGVIRLDQITGPTKIGYLYGGIQSFGSYTGEMQENGVKPTSVAYNQFIPVVLTPGNSTVTPMPPAPTESQ